MIKKIYNYCKKNKNYRLTIFWDNNGKFIYYEFYIIAFGI